MTTDLAIRATSGLDEELPRWNLPDCDWRVRTRNHNLFFCRHSAVHAQNSLVDAVICRECSQRERPAFLPRRVPNDPLLPSPSFGPEPNPQYISVERLASDVRDLIGKLPPDLSAVAGIPRSGMLPAVQIALSLHLPLLEVHQAVGLREITSGPRLAPANWATGTVLVVDDSVYTGAALYAARSTIRDRCPNVRALFAAVYPREEATPSLDFFGHIVPPPHYFEWNLFNCDYVATTAVDFDGILCQDWTEGDEEGGEYLRFLQAASPKWLPRRKPVPLIVTARLEKHRDPTVAWLALHGVQYGTLVMGPWRSVAERDQHYDAGQFKGKAYAESDCCLFVESDPYQAEAIFRVAKKPVLCPAAGRVWQ